MLINLHNPFSNKIKTQVNKEINIQNFVDLSFDTAGWYALGHYEPKKFLANVIKHDSYYSRFSVNQVRLTWAKFKGDKNNFEIIDKPASGAVAITLIADLMYLSGLI